MDKQLYIVGCDGTEWSERAANCAVNLAQSSRARIRFIYAIEWSGMRTISFEEIANNPPERIE